MRRQQYTYTITSTGPHAMVTIRPARTDGHPDLRYTGHTVVVTRGATGRYEVRGHTYFAREEQEAAFREALAVLDLRNVMDGMNTFLQA
jgi:hypothetical protein